MRSFELLCEYIYSIESSLAEICFVSVRVLPKVLPGSCKESSISPKKSKEFWKKCEIGKHSGSSQDIQQAKIRTRNSYPKVFKQDSDQGVRKP